MPSTAAASRTALRGGAGSVCKRTEAPLRPARPCHAAQWKNVKILKNAAKDLDANNFYYNNEVRRSRSRSRAGGGGGWHLAARTAQRSV